MTYFYKATARGVTATRMSETRAYTHAVLAMAKAREPDKWYPSGLPERPADPSFHASIHHARVEADRKRRFPSNYSWVEVAPVVLIDKAEYRALRKQNRDAAHNRDLRHVVASLNGSAK